MEEAGDCRNDATKMHSVRSGIESRGRDIHAGWHPAERKKEGEVRIIFRRNNATKMHSVGRCLEKCQVLAISSGKYVRLD